MGMYSDMHRDFAIRTKANLDFIDAAYNKGTHSVYNVTQLINSLLGIIIFLREGKLLPGTPVNKFAGGIIFEYLTGSRNTPVKLPSFLRSFRNAIAHGNIEDYGNETQIKGFILRDRRDSEAPYHWEIKISVREIWKIANGLVEHVIQNAPKKIAA